MINLTQKIPEEYREEFSRDQTVFIKSRVHLFCVLSIVLYFIGTLTGFGLDPGQIRPSEILVGLVLMGGGALILSLNHRASSLVVAKVNAFFFVILLLALMTELEVDYADGALVASSTFVFTMFFVSITIPWSAPEVIPVWILHLAAFTVTFLSVKNLPYVSPDLFGLQQYLSGTVFISMAFGLCLVIRRNESMRDMDNFVLFKEVETKKEQMQEELEWATRVHKTIIPESVSTSRLRIAVTYLPVSYVGGDYVKFEFIGEDKLIFMISDVTGHGVPAALLVNRMHAEFERLAREGEEPGALLKELNTFIKEEFEGSDMYLSAFCGLIDFKKMMLLYSNYGHPPQFLYRGKEGVVEKMPAQTSLLGLPVADDGMYQSETDIDRGDRIFLYTDGVTETVDSAGEQFGDGRLEEFLLANHGLPVDDFNDKLMDELNLFKDGSFKDDICILDIGIKAHKTVLSVGGQLFHRRKDQQEGRTS